MTVEQLVDIYRACGKRIVRTGELHWLFTEDGIALALPTLEDAYPTREQVTEVFRGGAKAVRFATTGPWEPTSHEFVLTRHPYTLEAIPQKSRNQVRRGLERCRVRRPEDAELLERAYDFLRDTADRQQRDTRISGERGWRQYLAVLLKSPDVFPYAAFVEGTLVAYVFVLVIGPRIVLYHPFMDRAYSKQYPMNAMIYTAINETRERVGPLPVSYGFGSVWRLDALDHFKIGMGFEKVPRLRIALFRGWRNAVLNRPLCRLVRAAPVLGTRFGHKFQRLVEEKELGERWWHSPTTPEAGHDSPA